MYSHTHTHARTKTQARTYAYTQPAKCTRMHTHTHARTHTHGPLTDHITPKHTPRSATPPPDIGPFMKFRPRITRPRPTTSTRSDNRTTDDPVVARLTDADPDKPIREQITPTVYLQMDSRLK